MIAAVRINVVEDGIPQPLSDHLKFEAFKDFPASSLTLTSRLMVAADWRASGATQVLLGAAYKIAQKRGSRFDFCACGPALVEIFELLGYRRYTSNFVDEDDGYQIPLVMVMEDAAYLLAIRSPFARLAIESKSGDNAVAWFTKHFGDHVAPVLTRRMNEEQFWEFLTERMHQTPLVGIPLLEGIRFADAKRLVKAGTVLRCKAGDRIVRAGEVGREMFVVLSGAVEVQGDAGNALTTLGAGALFGEIGLFSQSPRTANVVAKQDVEVLVLTQDFITRSMKSMPEVAAALLFNLSRILSARLRDSTRQWIDRLPIRLTPMTATCRVPPLSRVKLGIGWSRGVARDAEQ